MKVKVYMISNAIFEFPARNINNAREIAKRIIMEGLWTEEGEEEFYPITQIYKVKIITPRKEN
jgi:muconolactone delta-isomerase